MLFYFQIDQICDSNLRNTDQNIRIDLEKAFYHFAEAVRQIFLVNKTLKYKQI